MYVSHEFHSGDTLLYVGVVRRETNGTTAIAVELNKVNHANRQSGDLLITFEFDGINPVSDLDVRNWDGSEWDLVTLSSSDWDGGSWEHFGEVAINLSATSLLPPPTSVDDCDSFSSILPYGFAGESDNSNVGDDEAIYFQLDLGPTFDVFEGKASLSIPVSLGLSLDDYYVGTDDETFGYFSIGATLEVPLESLEGCSATFNAGVNFLVLGDTAEAANNGDSSDVYAFAGIALSF